MSRFYIVIFIWIITSATFVAQAENIPPVNDSIPAQEVISECKRDNLVQRVIKYFEKSSKGRITGRPEFSFIGGPHYSSDTKLGVGLLAAGLYSTDPENAALKPSNVTLFADMTTGKYFKIGVRGMHVYKEDTRRIDYEIFFNSYSTYYWGIGVDNGMCKANKTGYLLLKTGFKVDHLWSLWNNVYAGAVLGFDYTTARHIRNVDIWNGQPEKAAAVALGATIRFDSRDNYTSPVSGWLGDIEVSYSQGISSAFKKNFAAIEFNICNYIPVWREGVLALRMHGDFTFGDTPWCYMPAFGTSSTMRGYYEGQYRDKQEADITVELRQHLFRRSGIVVWGGGGAIFPKFSHLQGKCILPSYGLGYRWEFKKKTNVRVDVGFGKKCWGVEFNIGEAF